MICVLHIESEAYRVKYFIRDSTVRLFGLIWLEINLHRCITLSMLSLFIDI